MDLAKVMDARVKPAHDNKWIKSSFGVSLMYRTDTFRIPMAGPADMTKLTALIEDGALDPMHIVAILVKTEGNGGVNDFTREYTSATLAATLAPYLRATHAEVERRIDVIIFRACLAHSVYDARKMVVHGQVLLNGKKVRYHRVLYLSTKLTQQ